MALDSQLFDCVRVKTTTTGTGTLSLGATITGYLSFANVGVGSLSYVYYTIISVDSNGNPAGDVETGIGMYTSGSPDTLTRDVVFRSSNSNSLVSFAAGDKHVMLSAPARAIQPTFQPDFRLSLVTANPVPTTDQTAKSIVYYTPYTGNVFMVYNGKSVERIVTVEQSITLTGLTSGKNYDVYIWITNGTAQMDVVAWTDDTTRAVTLAAVHGNILTNNSSITGVLGGVVKAANTATYIGTIRTTATTTTEDSAAKRFVFNQYNRVPRRLLKSEGGTTQWNYSTATWRSLNNSSANQVEFVIGSAEVLVEATFLGAVDSAAATAGIGIGLDWTSGSPSTLAVARGTAAGASIVAPTQPQYTDLPGVGYHYLRAVEFGGTGAIIYGTNAAKSQLQGWLSN